MMHKRRHRDERRNKDDASDSKRTKQDDNPAPPSRVIHLRGLSSDITETEITNVAVPFGEIHYLVVTKKTGQALLEMETLEVAEAIFNYFQLHPPFIRNKRCFLQYSVHNSLQGPNSRMHPDADQAVQQANQQYESMAKEKGGKVLRFIIEEWQKERINSLHMYKMFYHFGEIEKIVAYINRGILQGFVEYTDSFSAKVARSLTQGVCVLPHGCRIKTYYSNRETLDITKEDDMVRDFTRHPVTTDELRSVHVNIGGSIATQQELNIFHSRNPVEALAALQPMLSQVARNPDDAMPLLRSLAPAIKGLLDSGPRERNSSDNTRFNDFVSPLLIVSNLNEEKVTPDALFKLFGHYGDVVRVKIMYNRKNTALVQFVNEEHAGRALNYLAQVHLFGKPMHINFSKHDHINNKAPGKDEAGEDLHKDYSGSKLHRFKRKTSMTNVYEPGKVLHLAGLVEEVSEEDLEELFNEYGITVEKIRIFASNGSKMALVEVCDVESAIESIIKLHDYDLGGSHLRVSFSKGYLR